MAAAAWIACGCELAVVAHRDRGHTAEVQILLPPARGLVAERLEPVELGGFVTALALDVRLVQVNARRLDRLLHGQTVLEHVVCHLQDGAA